MYRELSHYLFNNLFLSHSNDESFHVFNVFHWVYLFAKICGVFGLILAVLVHCRVRTIFILLAKTGHSSASKLPTLIYSQTSVPSPTTTLDTLRFHRMIQTLLPVDLTQLFCLILFFVLLLSYLFYKYRRSQKARTTLVIEITNAKQQLSWKLQSLKLSHGCYRFIVDRQAVSVK